MAKHARVLGPYEDRDQWRVIVVDEKGGRTRHIADGHQAAQRLVEKLKEQVAAPTADLIEEWLAAKLASGTCLEQTVTNQRHQIHQLLGRQVRKPARSLKPETAAALYADYSARCAVATHRLALRLTKSFWIAVAVLLCLCCGLRVSEAIGLRRRDMDGNELFVEGTKTARARRRVTLPDWLLPHLARLIADTLPEELLFPHSRKTLFHTVKRLCRAAGTPLTCPHGLRATWASAAVTGGATVEAVAATMGHSSTRVTLRHYVERDAVVNAQVAAFERLLNRSASVPPG